MKKFAFTFAEIVVAIVVMAVVVATVVPITRDKFVKADYTSYYAAYKNLQNVVSEVMLGIVSSTESSSDGTPTISNLGTISTPINCADSTSDGYEYCTAGDISSAYTSNYWAGANRACAEEGMHLPTIEELRDLYARKGEEGIPTSGWFWSSSESGASFAWALSFDNGNEDDYDSYGGKYTSNNSVLCIGNGSGSSSIDYKTQFCDSMKNTHAGPQNSCTEATSSVQTAVTSKDFSSLTPHITFSNGLKMYMASNLEEISALSDSVDEADREGFVVYVDIDGTRSKSKLYDDVFPFYLTKSGKVIPGYDASIIAGANCEKSLAFDILYDDFSSGDRKLKRLDGTTLDNTDTYSFKNAACLSGYVKSLKYCGFDPAVGKEVNGINCNTNTQADCRIRVRKPIRIFN